MNRGYGDSGRIGRSSPGAGWECGPQTSGTLDEAPIQDFSVPSGPSPPPPRPPADESAPSISRLSMSKRRFKVGQGVTFTFRISEPATTRILIDRSEAGRRVGRRCRPPKRSLRRRPRCTRYLRLGALERANLRPGVQRMTLKRRIGSRAVRRGRYRATIVSTDAAGNRSRPIRLTFRVVAR